MRTVLILSLTLALVSSAAQRRLGKASAGLCPPKPPTVPELDLGRYLGRWYQAEGLPASFSPSGSRCIAANYGDNGDGTISVRNSLIYPNGEYSEITGYAYQEDAENFPGDLTVQFPTSPKGAYWLIGTDYDNYASVYSCQNILGIAKIEFGWVLTRLQEPSQAIVDNARQHFLDNGIDISGFEYIFQGDLFGCIYECVTPDCAGF